MEVEVVADAALVFAPNRERFAGIGPKVVAEPVPVALIHSARQPKHGRTLAAPETGDFLAFGVVVGGAVVALGPAAAVALCDSKHLLILTWKPCDSVNTRDAHSSQLQRYDQNQ